MMRDPRPIVCVVPGDLHLTEPGLPNHRAALWAVQEVNELIRPDFVQFIGDNVQDGTPEQFALFNDLAARLEVPWHALVGDHDAQGDPRARRFHELVGPPRGTSSLRGFRFVRLNTQEARPVGLSADQLSWFRAEVDSALSAQERVVVFQHNYPYQIWEDFDGPGIDGWREVVQTRRISGIFTGHTHYLQMANDGRNVAIATRSIGDPEGGPPGYLVLFLHGEDLAVAYRTVKDVGPLVLVTHPREKLLATGPAHVVRGPDRLRVRAWSRAGVEGVRMRVDGGPWASLERAGEQDWECDLGGERLAKGEHTCEVEARDGQGREAVRAIAFAVDPTGRYTAVPGVWPVVTETAFC